MYKVEDIPMDLLIDNPYDQRKKYGDIEGLAESIKERGLKHPISVIKMEANFVIAHGHRRAHAFRFLKRKTIPAFVCKESTPEGLMLDLAIENLQRKDLLPTEKGSTIEQLLYTIPNVQNNINRAQSLISQVKLYDRRDTIGEGFTEEDVFKAKRFLALIGLSTTSASAYLRLLLLPEDIQRNVVSADNANLIPDGSIVAKSAYELTRINDPKLQRQLYEKVIADKTPHKEVKHIVDELVKNNDTIARESNTGSVQRKTEDDAGLSKLTKELFDTSASIESFRSKYLPFVTGRLEKAQWVASLNKMKKTCLDTVKNINDILQEDVTTDDLLDLANADFSVVITNEQRYRFPSRIANVLKVKDGDTLLLKVEGIKRALP